MKTLLVVASLLLTSTLSFSQEVTINLGAAVLRDSVGNPLQTGSLIQLLVSSTDNSFSNPSPGNFTGNSADDVIVASDSSNNFLGVNGSYAGAIVFTLTMPIGTGDQILLRWYPTLTTASAAPGEGDTFGQFRIDMVENGSDSGWFVPAGGATITLNFYTASFDNGGQPGSQPDSAGFANLTVIPEPSTYALLVGGLGLLGVVRFGGKRLAS